MEVSPEIANACMENYEKIMQGSDLKQINAAFTSTVSFNTPELAAWLTNNNYLTNSANIKICMGIYTQAVIDELKLPESYLGRLTTFLWPEKGADISQGKTSDSENVDADYYPFNLGELKP